ncbi:hypothetical protein LMG26411_03866 [Cupriavidus numazuensis]|uniref:Uncharacterized protein n=1 Tax=Cupriavidus numazuensis TaxID=221992 RepID=A0ABN7Q7I6_9BURK|nr:hypothetical protein LMG26411_03866 [Cupriavidus numazuensis]
MVFTRINVPSLFHFILKHYRSESAGTMVAGMTPFLLETGAPDCSVTDIGS